MDINLKVSNGEIIDILKILHNEYIATKTYFIEHTNQQDREGITSPDELRHIYNKILKQTQLQEHLLSLKPIKNSVE